MLSSFLWSQKQELVLFSYPSIREFNNCIVGVEANKNHLGFTSISMVNFNFILLNWINLSYINWRKSNWMSDLVSAIFSFYWYVSNKLIYIGACVESRGFCLASHHNIFFHIRNTNHWLVNFIVWCHSGFEN